MMHGMPFMLLFAAIVLGVLGVVIAAAVVYFSKPASRDKLQISHLADKSGRFLGKTFNRPDASPEGVPPETVVTHDTVFILPDISNYTKFMAGNKFAFGHAQHIIFSLIQAMIDAAKSTVELSKLEGDAALFYVDAEKHSDVVIGETVMGIFRAFFQERERLILSNLCPCRACCNINDLDLKIFVHRGNAARFQFRGMVDHFGTDVIVLHRMMKNGVKGHRYVMVTDAASDSISLPGEFITFEVEEEVVDIGHIKATVFEIDDETVKQLSVPDPDQSTPRFVETYRKLRENIRSIAWSSP